MFVDILPDAPEDDGIAYLSFFVEENENNLINTDEITANIHRELHILRNFMGVGEGTIMVSET